MNVSCRTLRAPGFVTNSPFFGLLGKAIIRGFLAHICKNILYL